MKTTKKLTAIILSIATLFTLFVTSASALEKGDYVEWDHYGDYIESIYFDGTIATGKHTIAYQGNDTVCYELTIEKDGYYSLTSSDLYFEIAENYSQNKAANASLSFINNYFEDGQWIDRKIYYLTKGTHLLKVSFYYYENSTFEIEFFADAITDIDYDEEKLKNLIHECEYIYTDTSEKLIGVECYYKVIFSNSEILEDDDFNWLEFRYEGEFKTNTEIHAKLLAPGYEEDAIIIIHDYIEDIKVENFEEYSDAKEYYDYTYEHSDFYGIEATITFTDGTKQTVTFGEDEKITFPNGREFYFSFWNTCDERSEIGTGELTLIMFIGESYPYYLNTYNTEKATFFENLVFFKDNISSDFEAYSYYAREEISYAIYNGQTYRIPQIILEHTSSILSSLKVNIISLAEYYAF